MALKDKAELTKMFSLVDAQNYQKVSVGNTIEQTLENYKKITSDIAIESLQSSEKSIVIEDLQNVVLNGNTVYYIKAKDDDKIYSVSIDINPKLAFVKIGDTLNISGNESENLFIITGVK